MDQDPFFPVRIQDPDPDQNLMYPKYCPQEGKRERKIKKFSSNLLFFFITCET
jgi:hypothetical protein